MADVSFQSDGQVNPKWVEDMHEHFRETGFFRSEDLQRVLGDQLERVELPASTGMSQFGRMVIKP